MASLLALPTTSEGNAIRQVVKALVEVRPVEDPRQEEVLKDIAQELERSLADVKARIAQVEAVPRGALGSPKEIRVMLNGCFDIMHAGHYNALRQAKASLAREGVKVILVAGVHSDEAIFEQKGPTVMKDAERRGLVEACKWVDEVAFGLPYLITPELLDKYNCDFVAHGDDLPIRTDGTGMYDTVIAAGRFKMIKRTEGTSTTVLIGRLLSMSREHLGTLDSGNSSSSGSGSTAAAAAPSTGDDASAAEQEKEGKEDPVVDHGKLQSMAMLLPTSERISQFADISLRGDKRIATAKRVVYIDGAFDLFHVGHMQALRAAAELGDFVLVGLHSDEVVNRTKGRNYPIQNLHERAFCVLSCMYADEVILGAPAHVTKDLITTMNIKVVVGGALPKFPSATEDPYAVPRELGLLQEIESGSDMTTETVIQRIIENRSAYLARNAAKEDKEISYLAKKEFVAERG